MTKLRIAILMHERDSRHVVGRYIITLMAEHWRDDGHEVVFLFGTDTFLPADVVIVHVDLSVVPDSYLEFAARYPVAVNGRVTDIRKRTIGRDLTLEAGDAWTGPVIVKSDLNYGGLPERRRLDQAGDPRLLRALRPHLSRWGLTPPSLGASGPASYRVLESLAEVPAAVFGDPALVVQKFLPERDGPHYCVRHYSFLGDRSSCVRLRTAGPIVNGTNSAPVEPVDIHPRIVELREELGFDYGKFDFVVVDGEAVLLDANKTIGCARNIVNDPELRRLRRYRADGLYSFLR